MAEQMHMSEVQVFVARGSRMVRFEFHGPIATTGTVLFGLEGHSPSGSVIRRYGVKYLDGARIAFYVENFNDAYQANLPGEPTEGIGEVLAPLPEMAFDGLGSDAFWSGFLNVDGVDLQTDVPVAFVS